MELKFHLITFLVLSAAFGTIETRRSSSSSSSRGRPSSSYSRPSSSHHTTSHNSYRPSHNSGSTNTFLHSERGHSTSTGNRPSSSGSDPYRHATAPSLSHGNSGSNLSPHRPFGTVPPPKHIGTSVTQSPFRPFGTVPPPKHIGPSVTQPPFRPFSTVLPPKHIGFPGPATPPPYGFNIPTGPKITTRPTSPPSPGFRYPSTVRPHIVGHHNSSGGGYTNSGYHTTARTPTFGGYNNSRNGYNQGPVGPPKPYPTQGYNPGGVVYPRQPAYNPGYHQGNPSYIQPNPSHIYQQTGPSLPPNPGHTVILLPGQSNSYGNSYGRTTGDIFKEALIHAGVNAAVHRLTSPNHYYDHYHHNSWNSYGTPPIGGSSISTTNTHTVNNYYTGQPTNSPSNNGGGSGLPPYNPGQNYPNGGVQGGSSPQGVIYPNVNNGNFGSTGLTSSPVNPQFPSNGQSVPSQNGGKEQSNAAFNWPGGITDEELRNITEKLFAMDETVYKFITINLQNQTSSNNTNATDASPEPLFSIHSDAYRIPTIRAIRTFYEVDAAVQNKTRQSSRKEAALLIDLILNTNVMTASMHFLAQKNLIKKDYFDQKDSLKRIWFTPYDGSSSGFKRVFEGEAVGGEILYGIQDWIAFDYLEKSGRANYFSYTEKIDLGKNATILKINFEMEGIKKLGTSIFVGISPELEMALYTICHYARPNYYCGVSLGGKQFNLYTHTFRYFGHDLIDLAFPIV